MEEENINIYYSGSINPENPVIRSILIQTIELVKLAGGN